MYFMKFYEWIVYLTHAIGSYYSRNWAIQTTGEYHYEVHPQTFSIVAPATTWKPLPGRGSINGSRALFSSGTLAIIFFEQVHYDSPVG
jgi:hypothetical protein